MSASMRIVNGEVYDPKNNINGEIKEICIENGKIVDSVSDEATIIDAKGMAIMPGGVDIHCHIAGPKVNLARKLMPEARRHDVHPSTPFTRSGSGGTTPSTFAAGYRYATLGYTTAMEAAVSPIGARHVLEEFEDTPIIDKGFYVLLGNNIFLHNLIREKRMEEFEQAVAWWVCATKAYTVKLVNPGGDEPWKGERNSNVSDIDEKTGEAGDLSPRQIIEAFVKTVNKQGYPHPPHIHCNNLGHSGNYKTTLETMKTAGDLRAHIAHIQFHSYGGELGKNPISKAAEIAEYVNNHPNITCDVGQVMFGNSTIMTADAPLAYLLKGHSKGKWVNADTECESGCGILPFAYQEHIYMHTLQWAIGLELFLLSEDPWRIILSTDHPNGGSFMAYPKLIKLLMDEKFRHEEMKRVNQKALLKCSLPELKREYTLNEIAIITRAGPAKALGLETKGHLGVGADADITIYDVMDDKEMMFSTPRYVIKSGNTMIENHEFKTDSKGKVYHITPEYDNKIEETLKPFFESYYSIEFSNYAVDDRYLHDHHEIIKTG
tara:strand:+ start:86 stop:1729 length:1644 start_codon:yes stop_codon:yes gene_type:complete